MKINLKANPHFLEYLEDWQHRYYMLVGGYGSSKSYNTALKVVLKCLTEERKVLVVREVFATLRDSTFDLLKEVISTLNVGHMISMITSPMRISFYNGSEIIFKGMDNPEKLKSINDVSIVWLEEASEMKYAGFKELLGRARHPDKSIHFILTTNPVSKQNWVYKHFFINDDDPTNVIVRLNDQELYKERIVKKDNIYYHHSTADDNKFLPGSYLETLEEIKDYDPDLYMVARKGHFGARGTKVLPQFKVIDHEATLQKIYGLPSRLKRTGMDFGFVNSYNAVVRVGIDHVAKDLYIYDEYYRRGMTDTETIKNKDFQRFKEDFIRADSAEPKTIAFYNQEGYRMKGAKKGPNSRLQNIKKMKRFRNIYCSNKCINCIKEMKDLTFKEDRQGNIIEDEFNIDPHTFEAIWYALDGYEVADIKERTNYSGKGAR